MAIDAPVLSQEDRDSLGHLSSLLHLFHHRNKNQHRRSIWYRHFSTFRRQLRHVILDFEVLAEVPSTHLARAKKKSEDAKRRIRIVDRLAFWRDILISRWHHAFSQLISDGRFAVLGLVLVAVLSQVCAILGLVTELEQLAQTEIEKVLENFENEDWGLDAPSRSRPLATADTGEDFGELVKRDDDDDSLHVNNELNTSNPLRNIVEAKSGAESLVSKKHRLTETPSKRSTKKRKKGDAIDDLFSGLR